MTKLLVAVLAMALFSPAAAETIRMRDGSYHSGEVVSADDDVVRIKFAENGLELELKWDQLASGEAQRLRTRQATEKASRFKIDGEVIYTRSDTLEGIVLDETPDKVKLRTARGTKDVAKSGIMKREKTQINMLSVYTPDEMYAAKAALYKLETPAGNFDLAELCLAIGLFVKAKEHFTKALELDPTWKGRVDPKLAKADSGIKEAEAAVMLKEAEKLVTDDKLEEAVAKFKEIIEKYPGTAAAVKAADLANKGEGDVTALKGEQKKDADKKTAKSYYDEMKSLIGKVIAKKDLTFDDIKGYAEKGLAIEILDNLATKLKVDRKQLEMDWKARELDEWKTASYGEGSWLMDPADLAIEKGTSQDDIAKKREKEALIASLKKQAGDQRKLVNEWWAKQNTTARINWLTAYAAEKTMMIKPVEHVNCNKCAGKGLVGSSSLCLRCLGTGLDRVVSYK
ncbi:MAG: hypothetical protein FD180_1782 [Planctomycetota bacterium]|nr:MAG: hypothetical protein FD180_1782 [Planctomycetota bacterium]